jgi:hypothetical protein
MSDGPSDSHKSRGPIPGRLVSETCSRPSACQGQAEQQVLAARQITLYADSETVH